VGTSEPSAERVGDSGDDRDGRISCPASWRLLVSLAASTLLGWILAFGVKRFLRGHRLRRETERLGACPELADWSRERGPPTELGPFPVFPFRAVFFFYF